MKTRGTDDKTSADVQMINHLRKQKQQNKEQMNMGRSTRRNQKKNMKIKLNFWFLIFWQKN